MTEQEAGIYVRRFDLRLNGRNRLRISAHAICRLFQRGGCYDMQDVGERIVEALREGFVSTSYHNGKKQKVLKHKDLDLFIKDDEIVTVFYNEQYYAGGAA